MDIKSILKKYGVTQNELAERLAINRVSVSRLLSDRNDMRISTAEKIASAIGCDVAEFFAKDVDNTRGQGDPTIICPNCGKAITIKIS